MILKVATFNLFQFCAPSFSYYFKKDKFNENEWQSKKEWIKKQLKTIDCDLIGFQEVFSQDELKNLLKELGFDYFYSSDTPKIDEKNSTIYSTTTVALASKFPIKSVEKVDINEELANSFNLENFAFSRVPIKALIELPNGNEIYVYVNHFKSNRLNEFEYIFKKDTLLEEKKEKVFSLLNNLPSQKQRLIETSSLFFDVLKNTKPIIFLCDLNDKEFSLSFDALTKKSYHNLGNEEVLFDAYYLQSKSEKREPTSYYKAVGNVIDYILLSKDFCGNFGEVISYDVFNKHLKENKNGSLLQSDHATVTCTINIE